MFGEMHPPKQKHRVRPHPVPVEYTMPCPKPPNCWAHPGRESNTDYHVKMLQYKQRKDADHIRSTEMAKAQHLVDTFSTKFDRHAEKRRFQGELHKRVNIRLQEYEDAIDRRREKLRDLYAKEERDFYRETIDVAQRGGETRMETMKKRAQFLQAKREAERQELLQQKRLQQYMLRCEDLRGVVAKKNLIESKNGQLQQIRENEARREREREMENMWHDLAMKEAEAKRDREDYDALDRYLKDKADTEVWSIQVQAKELLKAEAQRIAQEDRAELEKLQEQMRREEIEALLAKSRKRDEANRELKQLLEVQEKLVAQRHKEEKALDDAFTLLTQLELDRERAKIQDTVTIAKRESAQYRASLASLERERKEEDRQLEMLLNQYKAEIQKKQDEAKCKIEAAKKKLQRDVMKGRAEQIEYKRTKAEEELKRKQDEDEFMQLTFEMNGKLEQESAREELIAREQYREDLTKQIEYNKLLQEREVEEQERQLMIGKGEDERYAKMVDDMCSGKIKAGMKHPFRRVVERYDCQCPNTGAKLPHS